jgi:hypothetical protein
MMTFEGDMVMVAGLPGCAMSVLTGRGTTVMLGPDPPDTNSLCCWPLATGDLGTETGIMVIFAGVLAGEMATLPLMGMFSFEGDPGMVAKTVLPGEPIIPCEFMVTVFVGEAPVKLLDTKLTSPPPALLGRPVTCTGTAIGWLEEGFLVIITLVTTPGVPDPPDNGRFMAILPSVTTATGFDAGKGEVMVAPP